MAAGMYPYADGSGWPTTSSWLIRPENPSAGPMSPALWAIRQMQVGCGGHVSPYMPSVGAVISPLHQGVVHTSAFLAVEGMIIVS